MFTNYFILNKCSESYDTGLLADGLLPKTIDTKLPANHQKIARSSPFKARNLPVHVTQQEQLQFNVFHIQSQKNFKINIIFKVKRARK